MKDILIGMFLIVSGTISSQNSMLGLDFQVYPTGILPGIQFETFFRGQNSITTKLGVNVVRHRDLGIHEDERGSGAGGTVGYKYYFAENRTGWFSSLRIDLWWNQIDWKDQIGTSSEVGGASDITVFQPTLMGGHRWKWSSFYLDAHISFGYEVNVKTEGAKVGEGPILLIGLTGSFGI
jgi:hypothetical protein